jgi:hypothetical protein
MAERGHARPSRCTRRRQRAAAACAGVSTGMGTAVPRVTMRPAPRRAFSRTCPCNGPGPRLLTRRAMLAAAPVLLAASAAASRPAGLERALAALGVERRLSLTHAEDGEAWQGAYWRDGAPLPEAMAALSHLLRDRRANVAGGMDPGLFDLLALPCSTGAPLGAAWWSSPLSARPRRRPPLRRAGAGRRR